MSKFPTKPQRGQKALQAIYNSVCQIIDYLPTLEVRGDNKTISVSHSTVGTTIHANKNFAVTEGGRKYEAGSGLTLSGNVFNNALTSGQFIQITTGFAINCTLTGGNYIEITPQGVINYTGDPGGGGGGGTSYFADGFTLSTTSPTGNTFCVYDVLPLITGAGGTVVSRYGDAPLYPGYALGTVITTPVYAGASGIGIIDDSTPGSYIKYICITGDVLTDSFYTFMDGLSSYPVYDASNNLIGKNVGIVQGYRNDLNTITGRPSTGNYVLSSSGGTLSWAENSGGGGTPPAPPTAYYADNFTLSTTTADGTTFCMYDVLPLLTGGGGITVAAYGDAPLYPYNAKGTIISCPVYLPSTGIAIIDDQTEGTYNKYIAITGTFDNIPIQPGSGLISTAHTDPNSNPYNPTITSYTFDLSAHFYNDLISLSGRHNFNGGRILSSNNGVLSWEQNITKVSQLTNDAGYITSPGPAPTAYYADNITLSTVNGDGTTFYLLDVYPLLTGGGGTTVSYYGDAPGYLGASGTIISTPVYLPSTGIAIVDDETEGSYNKYIYVSGNYLDSSYYNFTNGLSAYNVLDANNNVIGQNVGIVEGYRNDLDVITGRGANKVLSSNAQSGLVWADNTASETTWRSLTPSLLAVDNSSHTLSAATQSGGGGGGEGYIRWPNYANLHNNGNSISIQTDYTADSNGGWLRISYKGTPQQQGSDYCYSLMIDGNAVGMYTLNSALGMMGNTWIVPIPPFSRFMVNFPTSNTYAYFDGTLYDSGDVQTLYATMIEYCNGAYEACDNAKGKYNDAKEKADWAENDYTVYSQNNPPNIDPPKDYWNNYWYARAYTVGWVNPNDSDDYICGAVQYAAEAQQYSTLAATEATRMKNAQEDVLNRADSYATSASTLATSAANLITSASGEADRVYNWYLSACQLSGQTPHPKNYANMDD